MMKLLHFVLMVMESEDYERPASLLLVITSAFVTFTIVSVVRAL